MIEELVAKIFKTRNQAHLSHWKTKSFAEHEALGSFYDELIDKLDGLVEACQGSKGIIGHVDLSCKDESVDIIKCLTDDANFISKNRSKIAHGVPALENILDEIVALYLTTLYKLKNLS
jgi:DNA-binding ferritin-like protein